MNANPLNPPGIIRVAEDLDSLAERIDAREEQEVTSILEHARDQGNDLLKAKKQCGHRKWLPWLKANVKKVKGREARNYMKIAREWEKLNWQRVANLGIRGALRLLTAKEEKEKEDSDASEPLNINAILGQVYDKLCTVAEQVDDAALESIVVRLQTYVVEFEERLQRRKAK